MAVVYHGKGNTMQECEDVLPEDNDSVRNDSSNSNRDGKPQTEPVNFALADSELGCPAASTNHAKIARMSAMPHTEEKREKTIDDQCKSMELSNATKKLEDGATDDTEPVQEENVDGEWKFRCVNCGETFDEKEVYLEHCREHTHDGPIVCLDSDTHWDDLLVSQDGGRKTLCCAVCGRKFTSSRGFFSHQLKHRNQALRYGQLNSYGPHELKHPYKCEDCGKTYLTSGQYLNHQRSHKQASKSVFHQLDDLKKKSFQCPTCGRSYSRASALDAHRHCHEVKLVKNRATETDKLPAAQEPTSDTEGPGQAPEVLDEVQKTPFKCDCGRFFRSLSGLITHQRFSSVCSPTAPKAIKVETKELFKCSQCEKQFVSPVALACHERWHRRRDMIRNSGVSLTCQECGKSFTSLTFYHKHQRLAHSEEAAAKSFLHQVGQIQKKSFECQDCGRRFSRASALQSHQLCHTDAYGDISETPAPSSHTAPIEASPPSPQKAVLWKKTKAPDFAIGEMLYSQDDTNVVAEIKSGEVDYTEEDGEMSDLNVEVVSVTASDASLHGSNEDPEEDQNPDLELVCESDVDEGEVQPPTPAQNDAPLSPKRYNESTPSQHYSAPPSPQHYKPEVDVKIVKVNFAPMDEPLVKESGLLMIRSIPQRRMHFECPECGRKFETANGLRCHRLWHRGGMGKRPCLKRKVSLPPVIIKRQFICEICGHKSYSVPAHNAHLGKHEDRTPYKSISYQLAELKKNSFKCEECGMRFSRLSALHSHQQHHNSEKKPFPCPNCNKSYSNSSGLYNHKKTCYPGKFVPSEKAEVKTENFNPKKSLLGPKAHHCKRCGKSFWSLGAYSHHRQYHSLCASAKPGSSPAVNGRPKQVPCPICGAKFRKGRGLKWHIQRHSQAQKEVHTCGECGKSYLSLTCFHKHLLLHAGPPVISPPAKSFDLQVEQVKKNSYKCTKCGKLFSRAMALQFHMKCHGFDEDLSSSKSSETRKLQCPTCPKYFQDEAMLENHQRMCGHTNNVTVMDSEVKLEDVVTQNAENAPELNIVSERSSEVKTLDLKYKCAICGRSFAFIGALNFHKRVHLKSHPKQVAAKTRLGQAVKFPPDHKPGKYPFACTDCGRHFSNNSALGTHKRWHTDKKFAGHLSDDKKKTPVTKSADNGPFLCSLCGKGFFYLCVLRRHQRHHPPINNVPSEMAQRQSAKTLTEPDTSSSSGRLNCPECDLTFLGGSALAAHYESQHAGPALSTPDNTLAHPPIAKEQLNSSLTALPPSDKKRTGNSSNSKTFRCPHCPKTFPKIRGLRAHKWQAHRKPIPPVTPVVPIPPQKPFPCPDCEKQYSSQGALYNHRKTCKMPKTEPMFPCPDCDKHYCSQGALYNHKKVCKPVKAEPPARSQVTNSKVEEPSVHKAVEVVSRCFFKCHKCGKAFPSEEQLKIHKDIAKTRPFCCALCCRGYWTEVQLQQHLAWHDEVRQRLPTELRYRLSTSVSDVAIPKCKPHSLSKKWSPQSKPSMTASMTTKPAQQGHKCQHCGKSFLSPFALQQHQAQHETQNAQPTYHCTLCPLTFTEVRDLIDHHQQCMGDKNRPKVSDAAIGIESPAAPQVRGDCNFTCMDCGVSFVQETELHQHYIQHAQGQC